ncbi:hypothetical protein FF2_024346 [Malus domestica]
MKWVLELGQYDFVFRPHMTIKAQALADFIVEFMPSLSDATELYNDTLEAAKHNLAMHVPFDEDLWHLHVDGESNYKGKGASVLSP